MKKYFIIFILCLLAVSCNQVHQQAQNTQVVLPVVEELRANVPISSSTGQVIKKLISAVPNKTTDSGAHNVITDSSLAPEPVLANFVNMKIITPEGESSFTVELKDGQNACDNLYEAKAEGKVKSLTIKDAYLESMGSLYLYEINGYKNNWILSLNGKSSSYGCSKVFPKIGDVVEWKFN